MHNPVQVTSDMYWVGASDRRLALFENVFPIPKGVSYNSYLVLDEKTVLLDTTDRAVSGQMLENIAYLLNGRALDYLIVNHMEPDHAASMGELVLRYPAMQIVCNAKALAMIRNYFDFDIDSRVMVVKEGDTLQTGRHSFSFVMAPMVHWPEVMVTYDAADRVLYCADAFGTFGALNGNILQMRWTLKGNGSRKPAVLYQYRRQIWQPGSSLVKKGIGVADRSALPAARAHLAVQYCLVCGKV